MSQRDEIEARDLVQHQIISAVATQQRRHPKVCFKGGTLLRSCWQNDYRFSEDLDFDWMGGGSGDKDAVYDFFDKVTSRASRQFGGEYSVRWGAHNMRLDWVFDGQSGAIKVDVKSRNQSQTEPTRREWQIIDRYPSVRAPHKILGYSLESVMAAKLACIVALDRAAARDYYDLYRLMNASDIDRGAALAEFLERLRSTDPSALVGDDWQSLVFDSIDAKMPALEEDWATIETTGMFLGGVAPRFNDLVISVLDDLTTMPMHPPNADTDNTSRSWSEPVGFVTASARFCGRRTKTGSSCKHPKPPPGGRCAAGHQH